MRRKEGRKSEIEEGIQREREKSETKRDREKESSVKKGRDTGGRERRKRWKGRIRVMGGENEGSGQRESGM